VDHFATLLQHGNAWLFVPSAILLGALHGLEPGHSKTMMAAFIVAIRGTVTQAVLLGVAATVSHTAIVWAIALSGLYFGSRWQSGAVEPYLQLLSALLIILVALWMVWRTWRAGQQSTQEAYAHDHDEARRIDTGHGVVSLQIYEQGVAPRFRLESLSGASWPAEQVRLETERADGTRELFSFCRQEGYLESQQQIPEPHEFVVRLRLGEPAHSHDYDLEFVEHGHQHAIGAYAPLDLAAPGYQDPHELAHANDIRERFASRPATTGQIVLFGLTGGLVPCPASITILLLCLQLKRVSLGAALVLCFSIGLALTLVATGTLAALGARHAARRFACFGELVRRAPYVSAALIVLVGLYVGYQGFSTLR
jgi:nickel/cobalt transporter (NicO) family protein